mmetsp:Transcript_14776/g.42633  ORF Transcript_14776/g.42633 Transcript_14776/m.42633 type:complete len:373 (-) Transcript_14776:370-1488(-)
MLHRSSSRMKPCNSASAAGVRESHAPGSPLMAALKRMRTVISGLPLVPTIAWKREYASRSSCKSGPGSPPAWKLSGSMLLRSALLVPGRWIHVRSTMRGSTKNRSASRSSHIPTKTGSSFIAVMTLATVLVNASLIGPSTYALATSQLSSQSTSLSTRPGLLQRHGSMFSKHVLACSTYPRSAWKAATARLATLCAALPSSVSYSSTARQRSRTSAPRSLRPLRRELARALSSAKVSAKLFRALEVAPASSPNSPSKLVKRFSLRMASTMMLRASPSMPMSSEMYARSKLAQLSSKSTRAALRSRKLPSTELHNSSIWPSSSHAKMTASARSSVRLLSRKSLPFKSNESRPSRTAFNKSTWYLLFVSGYIAR